MLDTSGNLLAKEKMPKYLEAPKSIESGIKNKVV